MIKSHLKGNGIYYQTAMNYNNQALAETVQHVNNLIAFNPVTPKIAKNSKFTTPHFIL